MQQTNDITIRALRPLGAIETPALVQSIIDALDEISARGDFCDADYHVTDGLDTARALVQDASDWLVGELA